MSVTDNRPIYPKAVYSIEELLAIHPEGRTKIYEAINEGDLVARKHGKSTLILHSDYLAYLERLPRIEPKRKVPEAA